MDLKGNKAKLVGEMLLRGEFSKVEALGYDIKELSKSNEYSHLFKKSQQFQDMYKSFFNTQSIPKHIEDKIREVPLVEGMLMKMMLDVITRLDSEYVVEDFENNKYTEDDLEHDEVFSMRLANFIITKHKKLTREDKECILNVLKDSVFEYNPSGLKHKDIEIVDGNPYGNYIKFKFKNIKTFVNELLHKIDYCDREERRVYLQLSKVMNQLVELGYGLAEIDGDYEIKKLVAKK